ncbi:DNA methylase family protein (plasmid) [Roseomonas mucosa]|uniref:Methyltransferase n=2 Tax=Roseomonadaceae TaxID=3385906 RepID=A0A379PKI0_9PROT|nr:DNA methylase family protein [Roseomonas mucosa]SUE95438.1 DNA methylase [Roseomonas mucosa]
MFDSLAIPSPKRNRRLQVGWEGFFPYYAGYPEAFASDIISSARLAPRAVVLDPWNGSGTTIYAARNHGHLGIGLDLNPVMIAVARARLLPPSEADSLEPLGQKLIDHCDVPVTLPADDPLLSWFDHETARHVRAIEQAISSSLVGRFTISERGADLDRLSSIASAFYVALFAVARSASVTFRSSNPTWWRRAKSAEELVHVRDDELRSTFLSQIRGMAEALSKCADDHPLKCTFAEARLADSTSFFAGEATVDFVLTSPPYCTRIDYAVATQIELAVLNGLIRSDVHALGRRMIGSTRVPSQPIEYDNQWGTTCRDFLEKVRLHPSKSSAGYYLKTHLDYFDKMSRSISRISSVLKDGAAAIFVVQDSHYKDIHNNLPAVLVEMAASRNLQLMRREDFTVHRTMAAIHPHATGRTNRLGTVESVLCFQRGDR